MKTPVPYELTPYPGELSEVVQLPLWPDTQRGAPNSFLRSALFAATQGRDRHWMKGEIIASHKGITVKYTGEQLTQTDLDVWETLTHLARIQPLGSECVFTARGLLKALGRDTGKSQHEWLHRSILRLIACAVEIQFDRKRYAGSLVEESVDESLTDETLHAYRVRLNPRMIVLFNDNNWTRLDWADRLRMLKRPLAQWLHAYWSTHAAPIPVRVKLLQELTSSNIKAVRDFKIHLRRALDTLVKIAFLESYTFEHSKDGGDVVCVKRHARPSLPPPSTPSP